MTGVQTTRLRAAQFLQHWREIMTTPQAVFDGEEDQLKHIVIPKPEPHESSVRVDFTIAVGGSTQAETRQGRGK